MHGFQPFLGHFRLQGPFWQRQRGQTLLSLQLQLLTHDSHAKGPALFQLASPLAEDCAQNLVGKSAGYRAPVLKRMDLPKYLDDGALCLDQLESLGELQVVQCFVGSFTYVKVLGYARHGF